MTYLNYLKVLQLKFTMNHTTPETESKENNCDCEKKEFDTIFRHRNKHRKWKIRSRFT